MLYVNLRLPCVCISHEICKLISPESISEKEQSSSVRSETGDNEGDDDFHDEDILREFHVR
jgi:hypothetical protein